MTNQQRARSISGTIWSDPNLPNHEDALADIDYQLPEGVFSHIQAPVPGQSQRLRQQAVVWLAQDVYVARLRRARGLEEQLKMVELWRDIMFTLGDTEGVGKLHDMLHQVLGSRWRNLGSF